MPVDLARHRHALTFIVLPVLTTVSLTHSYPRAQITPTDITQ